MPQIRRGRVSIALGDGWRLYSPFIPAGYRAIGTVTRDGTDTGALVVSAAGVYAQLNAGALRSLPQALVVAEIPNCPTAAASVAAQN